MPYIAPTLSQTIAMVLIAVLGLGLVLALAGWPSWQRLRRSRIAQQPFPAAWRRILRRRVPYLRHLPAARLAQLKQAIQVFLAETPFIGCAGLTVSEEMRVTVAAQACLLLLGRPDLRFADLRQVLLYPAAFVVDRVDAGPAGVQSEHRRVLAGESWGLGQVVLSWHDVVEGAAIADDGRNVVIHEFAHQLDQQTGRANGAPALARPQDRRRWAEVLQVEYQAVQERLRLGRPGLIDPYAATDPAEFFAVLSEVFFERPALLQDGHPELYAELARFYQLDPAQWLA